MPRPLAPTRLAIAAVVAAAMTAAGATAPTTRPAVGPESSVGRWFDQLADPDPAVRDAAREGLMGLPADRLPDLLQAVHAAAPVRPAQAAVLHDIVTQVFLAGEHYAAVGDDDDPQGGHVRAYVIGIRWPEQIVAATARLGVPVVDRWPGFPARRLLRDGDLIVGVFVNPDAPLQQLPNEPTHTTEDIRRVILAATEQAAHDGAPTRVVLLVLRDGRERRVAVTLVPQPVDAAGRAMMAPDVFVQARQQRADQYWDQTFGPLVDPDDHPADADATASLDGPGDR